MEIQSRKNDLFCITEAFKHLSGGNAKAEHRSLLMKDVIGHVPIKKYLNLNLKKCNKINDTINIKIINGNSPTDPKFNTISVPDRPEKVSRDIRNPYQNKINYFHSAMRNSKINSALISKKDQKLKKTK